MKKEFLEMIHRGDYQSAKKLISDMKITELSRFLIDLSVEIVSINIYTFVCFLLMEHETVELHYCAAGILDHGLCFIEGAASASLFHARRADRLAPDDIACKKELLRYYGMPDEVMSRKEAKKIALSILQVEPDNNEALEIIKE